MSLNSLLNKLQKGENSTFYVAVIPINPMGQVLLGKRVEDGIWTSPAGGSEPGETPEQVAVREGWEEAQLKINPLELELLSVKDTPNNKIIYCYLYRTSQIHTSPAADPDREVKEWLWVSPEHFPKELSRKKNLNRLQTINEALMKFHGLSKGSEAAWRRAEGLLERRGPESLLKYIEGIRQDDPKLASEIYMALYPNANDAQTTKLASVETPKIEKSDKWLKVGMKVESEHTNDPNKAKKIAQDHLNEDPDYYKDWDNKEKILFQEKAPKLKKDLKSLTDKLQKRAPKGVDPDKHERCVHDVKAQGHDVGSAHAICTASLKKGGPGSGVKGHHTAEQAKPTQNPLERHLEMLQNGVVLPGAQTKSGKPIVNDMDIARAQGYTTQDFEDALNEHYRLAQKVNDIVEKFKMAGKPVPPEAAKIAKFHEKKMKENMRARDLLESRQKNTEAAVQNKKKEAISSVKKSVTQMGGGLGDRDLDIGAFSQTAGPADRNWIEHIFQIMEGFEFGDTPREISIQNNGTLHLSKVDDGIYSGFFVKTSQVEGGSLEDTARIRLERLTIPELVQLMEAKEWLLDSKAPTQRSEPELEPEALPEPLDVAPEPSQLSQRIRILELISKLTSL